MKYLLINCDDVGMHPSINRAVCDLFARTPLTSCSLMANGLFFTQAVEQLKAVGIKEVGVHLAVTSEYAKLKTPPVSSVQEVPSLLDKQGNFFATCDLVRRHAKPVQIISELRRQIDKVLSTGLGISHLDGHMFFYEELSTIEELSQEIRNLAEELDVPLRDRRRRKTHFIWEEKREPRERRDFYLDLLKNYLDGFSELILHPTDSVEEVGLFSQSAIRRYSDYIFFAQAEAIQLIQSSGIVLTNWKDVHLREKENPPPASLDTAHKETLGPSPH